MKLKMATVALLVLGLGVQLQVGVARAAAGEILFLALVLPFSHRGLPDRQKVLRESLPSPDLSLAIFTQGIARQAKTCRSLKATLFTNRIMHKLTLPDQIYTYNVSAFVEISKITFLSYIKFGTLENNNFCGF